MFFNYDRMSFQILKIARFYHKDGKYTVPARPYAAITLRIGGTAVFKLGNTTVHSHVGDVMFLAAHTRYEVEYQGNEMICIDLNECPYPETENIHLHNPKYIHHFFDELLEQWNTGSSGNAMKAGVYSLLSKLEEETAFGMNRTVQRCSQYIQLNYTQSTMKIADVCQVGNISEATLYRGFTGYYGMSPKQYVLKLRLEHAVELLLQGGSTVEEISEQSGFQDAKYFARAFKKHYGLPPTQYCR